MLPDNFTKPTHTVTLVDGLLPRQTIRDDRAFRDELRRFLAEIVTGEVIAARPGELRRACAGTRRCRLPGNRLPLEHRRGSAPCADASGNFEIGRAPYPWFHWGTTAMVAPGHGGVSRIRSCAREIGPGCSRANCGCAWATRTEGQLGRGHLQDAGGAGWGQWIINGSKMFTSNAHKRTVFLITNTDPDAPNTKPLHVPGTDGSAGVEGSGACARSTATAPTSLYYSDVLRVPDRYRISELNGGWAVLRRAGCRALWHGRTQDRAGQDRGDDQARHRWPSCGPGRTRIADVDDTAVAYRLGQAISRIRRR